MNKNNNTPKPNEIQNQFQFEVTVNHKPPAFKNPDEIICHDCQKQTEPGGYRFALVPICDCCRTEREVQITRNRFARRMRRD